MHVLRLHAMHAMLLMRHNVRHRLGHAWWGSHPTTDDPGANILTLAGKTGKVRREKFLFGTENQPLYRSKKTGHCKGCYLLSV